MKYSIVISAVFFAPHSRPEPSAPEEACIKAGENYSLGGGPGACCAKTASGHSVEPNEFHLCPCSEVGSTLFGAGASAEDCCTGRWNQEQKCEKRPCGKAGAEPGGHEECCRDMQNHLLPRVTNVQGREVCGCFHVHQEPHFLYATDPNDCCSGRIETTGECGCISDHTLVLKIGTNATDCCSNKTVEVDGQRHCQAPECSEVGAHITGGGRCCSGSVSPGSVCMCLPAKAPSPGGDSRHCCSGSVDSEGKCGYRLPGQDPGVMAGVCESGKVHEGKCSCVAAGQISANETHCCSSTHEPSSNKCACMPDLASLVDGAAGSDCCSKRTTYDGKKCGEACG